MNRLIHVLSATEAASNCCFANECDADPSFEVATDHGTVVACDLHVEELLPPEERPPQVEQTEPPAPGVRDIRDIFKAQDAILRVTRELDRRAAGLLPNDRFDPILDALLDLEETLSRG